MKTIGIALVTLMLLSSCMHMHKHGGGCHDKKDHGAESESKDRKDKPGGCKDCESGSVPTK